MNKIIMLNHGSGGRQANELINTTFALRFGMTPPMTDSAILELHGGKIAFTTDSYVVDPIFFPGGNIGKLAVCGTINDLAVSAAEPGFISASFIIEEGFSLQELGIIAESMADEAKAAGVRIVTGDTKVVERGKCDKLFINTSGIGILKPGLEHISTGSEICAGDKIIINGSLGNHALAILGARNSMSFTSMLTSDCASLNRLINKLVNSCNSIKFMRDLTRGGLAAVLNELAGMINAGMIINEQSIPVDEQVCGLCETLGFDPLYLANEGKFIIVADPEEEMKILDIMRADPLGSGAATIGHIGDIYNNTNKNIYNNINVILETAIGGKRIIDMPSGVQLPRIC